ncbi:MAG: hypothetical protein LBS53_08330 [Synergistaceae bacterium]|nr:hypothetical protein [Synergistaceae bacterium]
MNSSRKILMAEDSAVKIDSLKSEPKIRGFNVVVVLDRNDTIPPSLPSAVLAVGSELRKFELERMKGNVSAAIYKKTLE